MLEIVRELDFRPLRQFIHSSNVCLAHPPDRTFHLVPLHKVRQAPQSDNKRPLNQSTEGLHLDKLLPGKVFHAFRRFFVPYRRAQGMTEEVLRALVGHASGNITERYSLFGRDAAQRREWLDRVRLGFDLPNPHGL